jgi:hypothetical protein
LLNFSPLTIIARSIGNWLYSDNGVPPFSLRIIACFVETIFTEHYYFNDTNFSGIVLEYAGTDLPGFGRTSSHSINSPRAA